MKKLILLSTIFLLLSKMYPQQVSFSELVSLKKEGDAAYEIVEKEYTNSLLQINHNEEAFYDALYTMFSNYQPILNSSNTDEELKSTVNERLNTYYSYLVTAAVYYYEKQNYTKATDGFEMVDTYINSNNFNTTELDESLKASIPYYAAVSAYSNDNQKAVYLLKKLIERPYIKNDLYEESSIYELLAEKYKEVGDIPNYLTTLHNGIEVCPNNSYYFIANLINYYIEQNDYSQAHAEIDNFLKNNNPTKENYASIFNVKGLIYLRAKEYKKAEKIFKQLIKKIPKANQGYDGLATSYILQAQELKDKSTDIMGKKQQVKLDKEANKLYKKALHYAKKMKTVAENNSSEEGKKRAIHMLRNIYYNLGMNREYDALENDF